MKKANAKGKGKPPICDGALPQESQEKFELELAWCLKNLENYLSIESAKSSGKGNSKLMEASKVFNALRNPKTQYIRKRQLMNSYWGDYRTKMMEESSQLKISPNKMKVKNYLRDGDTKFKAIVVRKRKQNSLKKDPPPSEFQFNFSLSQT